MDLTQDDVPICRILFNKETHAMALALYGERAKEIYEYICKEILYEFDFFGFSKGYAFFRLLRREPTASFFFYNNLIDFYCFRGVDIYLILINSPIAEKIWDSGLLDSYLYKMDDFDIQLTLKESPVRKKIKQSGKLKLK